MKITNVFGSVATKALIFIYRYIRKRRRKTKIKIRFVGSIELEIVEKEEDVIFVIDRDVQIKDFCYKTPLRFDIKQKHFFLKREIYYRVL